MIRRLIRRALGIDQQLTIIHNSLITELGNVERAVNDARAQSNRAFNVGNRLDENATRELNELNRRVNALETRPVVASRSWIETELHAIRTRLETLEQAK